MTAACQNTPSTHPDNEGLLLATRMIACIATEINEKIRRSENTQALLEDARGRDTLALYVGPERAVLVAMPMILHRQTDAITAGLTSMRLFFTQMPVMLFWGALITVGVVLALLPWFAGLLVVGPVLGHASWHAYRAAVAD